MKTCAVAAGNDRYGVLTADGNDDTDYSADRNDLIAYREIVAHFVSFFFLLALGTDEEEIEYRQHENDH